MYRINEDVLSLITKMKLNIESMSDDNGYFRIRNRQQDMKENRADFIDAVNFLQRQKKEMLQQTEMLQKPQTVKNLKFDKNDKATWAGNVGRNEPCPSGSGKKFKQCCGKID
jgi:uncharacterized protein YecA (UPF0149 family)